MKITANFFEKIFKISAPQFAKFKKLHEIFSAENEKINLSAIRNSREIWEKHFFDSLLISQFLRNENCSKILDIGTGGGFPLLPNAIIFENKNFAAIESREKKIKIVQKFCSKLKIENCEFLNSRAEILAHEKNFRENFDAVFARAFAPLPIFIEVGAAFLRKNKFLIAFCGGDFDEKIFKFAQNFSLKKFKILRKNLPNGDPRTILIFQKLQNLPRKFPRIWVKIKSEI